MMLVKILLTFIYNLEDKMIVIKAFILKKKAFEENVEYLDKHFNTLPKTKELMTMAKKKEAEVLQCLKLNYFYLVKISRIYLEKVLTILMCQKVA